MVPSRTRPTAAVRTSRRPGLLLAWAPPGITAQARHAVSPSLEIGRAAGGWSLGDEQLSARHFVVQRARAGLEVQDLESTNGTFLDGTRLVAPAPLAVGGVVRAGRCVFVACADVDALAKTAARTAGRSAAEHRAALPAGFVEVLRRAAAARKVAPAALEAALGADHFEALCLADPTTTRVRALHALGEEIVTRVQATGGDAEAALRHTFGERFAHSPVAKRAAAPAEDPDALYEAHRDKIVALYWASASELAETERSLRAQGILVERRWLAEYLERWGVR